MTTPIPERQRCFKKAFAMVFCLAALFFETGCASIVNGTHQQISFNTTPQKASITIQDDKGTVVGTGSSPCQINLRRARSFQFTNTRYRVHIEKPGFDPIDLEIRSRPSGWMFGNILWGGLIGILIVDPATGGYHVLEPSKITEELVQTYAIPARSGTQTRSLILSLQQDSSTDGISVQLSQ